MFGSQNSSLTRFDTVVCFFYGPKGFLGTLSLCGVVHRLAHAVIYVTHPKEKVYTKILKTLTISKRNLKPKNDILHSTMGKVT